MKLAEAGAILTLLSLCRALPQHNIKAREATNIPNYTKLSPEQLYHLQHKGFGPTIPTPFRAAYEESENEDEDEDISLASSQSRRPIYSEDAYYQNSIPVQARPQYRPQQQQQQPQPQPQRNQYTQQSQSQQVQRKESLNKQEKKKEEEEEEEPDRLSLLLPQSHFDCSGKNTGYYADEELTCEVFHYCQDNSKHSWICPEGFTFHQVHLICMPPGGDNICAKSSQFHFVNEFLYKPVNLEEHNSRPNISLKYADRYYPENYYDNNNYANGDEDIIPPQYHRPSKRPIRVGLQQVQTQQHEVSVARHITPKQSPTLRPETNIGQVFRSPEEVNISLQQRRPHYNTQKYHGESGY